MIKKYMLTLFILFSPYSAIKASFLQDATSMVAGGVLVNLAIAYKKSGEYGSAAILGVLSSGVGYATYYLAKSDLSYAMFAQCSAAVLTAAMIGSLYGRCTNKGYNSKIKKGDNGYQDANDTNNAILLGGLVGGAITGVAGLGCMQLVSRFLPSVVSLTTSATN